MEGDTMGYPGPLRYQIPFAFSFSTGALHAPTLKETGSWRQGGTPWQMVAEARCYL